MRHGVHSAGRIVVGVGAVAGVTALYSNVLPANPTTVALTYVVAILVLASTWGIAESTVAAVLAVVCFNFFFLPPVGTLTIADPQNWVALVAFLLTAIIASQLSGRARQRTLDALRRQRDLERLYALSRALLLSEASAGIPGVIARHIAETFEVAAVGMYDQRADVISWAGTVELPDYNDVLRDVARRGVTVREPNGLTVLAIQLGGVATGSVAMLETASSDTVMRSIANLAAIGLERARGADAAARAEVARQSSELRATVLDALAHEFKTPLTSMKAASGDLVASPTICSRDRELALIVNEEVDRLQALVTDAIQMLRIDAGDFAVHRDRHRLGDIVAGALRPFEAHLDDREVMKRMPDGLMVDADRDLLSLALRQLIDNALKYSPPASSIEISADAAADCVRITVRNSGSIIPEHEVTRVAERYYRGERARNVPGTGMGLAIVRQIAQAHGGALTIASSPTAGSSFTISLPREGTQS
jgi:two-component system sensor histidine kinase KdpD